MGIKHYAKKVAPLGMWFRLSKIKERVHRAIYRRRSLRKRFAEIYTTGVWGPSPRESTKFYSGRGSDDEFSQAYVGLISDFIKKHGVRTVVDIGCGDFRIGRQLVELNPELTYTGVDVVAPLIKHNSERFAGLPRINFVCLDAARDHLPPAELVLIRQVLQHLSNKNVASILDKTKAYKWVFASDATPPNEIPHPNEDMVDGFVVRERGLFIERPPFNKKCECLLVTSILKPGGQGIFENIRTMFIDNTAQ
jgi:SAM-dependent methyltransferase